MKYTSKLLASLVGAIAIMSLPIAAHADGTSYDKSTSSIFSDAGKGATDSSKVCDTKDTKTTDKTAGKGDTDPGKLVDCDKSSDKFSTKGGTDDSKKFDLGGNTKGTCGRSPVPEASTSVAMGIGMAMLGIVGFRSRRKQAAPRS